MSLNSLAASRVARELAPTSRARYGAASDDHLGPAGEDVQNALSALVEYVPAETISLYLAVIGSLPVLARSVPGLEASHVYWTSAALTPALYTLIYAGKRRAAGQPRFPKPGNWPWWPMSAATIAFLAWGLAVPDGPYLADENGRVVAGLTAIVVSTILGVAGRFFGPKPERTRA